MSELEQTTAPRRKPKRSATSPTKRTLAECRKLGWTAQVVEKFVRFPPPGHHVDLFGVLDIVAIATELAAIAYPIGDEPARRPTGLVGIQACSATDHAKRRAKILAEPRARQWVEAGGRLELWSWAKQGARGKRKTWTLRVEVFTEGSWAGESKSIGGA